MAFCYVDIKTRGCEGWLNLFWKDQIICLVDNVAVAEEIRKEIEPMYAPPCADCGAVVPIGYDHECQD